MDETLQKYSSTESMPQNCSSCFTSCFQFSNKKLSREMKAAANTSKNNKPTSLTFFSRCCSVDKSAVETNHPEAAVSEKPNRSTKDFTYFPKLDKALSQQKNNKKAAGINNTYISAAAPGHTNSKVHNHRKNNSVIGKHNIIEENSKFHQSILLVKDPNQQNSKKEKKISRSQVENNVVSTKTTRVLPHSISLPPPNRKKEEAIRGENDIINNGGEIHGKLDPIVGMSIMMGTLAIMIIWGKVCAILCTCAWLYLVPRLRIKESFRSNSGSLDFQSVEYKKKVVLEGLLQRDRLRAVGNL